MDDLSCEICMEMFDEAERRPKSLECGHTMCLSCIQRLGVCSWDRLEVENPDDLRDNYYLLRRIETNAARRFWCLECENVASKDCEDEHRICSLKKFRTGEVLEQSRCLEAAVELHRQVLSKLLSTHSELSSCIQRLVDDLTRDQSELQDSLNRLQDILDNGGSQEAWLAARQRCGTAARRAEEVLPSIQRECVLLEHSGMLSLKLWDRAQRGICLGAHVSLAAEAETQEVLRLVLFLLNRSGQLVDRSPVHAPSSPPQQARHQRGESQQNCNGEESDLENRLVNDEDDDDDWSDADEIEVLGACALQESEANERKNDLSDDIKLSTKALKKLDLSCTENEKAQPNSPTIEQQERPEGVINAPNRSVSSLNPPAVKPIQQILPLLGETSVIKPVPCHPMDCKVSSSFDSLPGDTVHHRNGVQDNETAASINHRANEDFSEPDLFGAADYSYIDVEDGAAVLSDAGVEDEVIIHPGVRYGGLDEASGSENQADEGSVEQGLADDGYSFTLIYGEATIASEDEEVEAQRGDHDFYCQGNELQEKLEGFCEHPFNNLVNATGENIHGVDDVYEGDDVHEGGNVNDLDNVYEGGNVNDQDNVFEGDNVFENGNVFNADDTSLPDNVYDVNYGIGDDFNNVGYYGNFADNYSHQDNYGYQYYEYL